MSILFTIIVLIIPAALFYYFVLAKNGKLSFWKVAAKNPNMVYEQIMNDNAWHIDDGTPVDMKKYTGPFRLYVPILKKSVKFYGEIGKYEESEKRILEKLRLLNLI